MLSLHDSAWEIILHVKPRTMTHADTQQVASSEDEKLLCLNFLNDWMTQCRDVTELSIIVPAPNEACSLEQWFKQKWENSLQCGVYLIGSQKPLIMWMIVAREGSTLTQHVIWPCMLLNTSSSCLLLWFRTMAQGRGALIPELCCVPDLDPPMHMAANCSRRDSLFLPMALLPLGLVGVSNLNQDHNDDKWLKPPLATLWTTSRKGPPTVAS